MQRELHVAREGNPVAGAGQFRADALEQRAARGERLRFGCGQFCGAHGGQVRSEFTLEFRADMDEGLQGKTALVTGAARRIGAAIARRLHAAGANVVLHYRGAEAEAAALEAELNAARAGSAAKVKADLLAPIAPRPWWAAALERFGRLDVLVNNASSFYPTAVGSIEAGHWEELMGSNLRAPLFIAQEAAPELREAARRDRQHRRHPRRAAAEGLRGLQHREGGPRRADARAGARARARGARQRGRARARSPGPRTASSRRDERARIVATTPLARLGAPEEIARAVHFLATAPFVTGQILAVDGGRSVFL